MYHKTAKMLVLIDDDVLTIDGVLNFGDHSTDLPSPEKGRYYGCPKSW